MRVEQLSSNVEIWKSRYGTINQREALNIRIGVLKTRYSGKEPRTTKVRFYFIAQSRDKGGRLEIYHYQELDHGLRPSQETQCVTVSPLISLRKNVIGGQTDFSGIVPFGWVAQILDRSRVVKTVSSTPEMVSNLEKLLVTTRSSDLQRLNKEANERDQNR